ncbi:MAG TPA: TolC family protein [Polyangia bacterium]|nr:TolC family protein [Polyangia bacterium]
MTRAWRTSVGGALLAWGALAAAQPAKTPAAAAPPAPSTPQARQAQSITPAQAMQVDALPPELPHADVLSFDAAVNKSLARNPQAKVALEEINRAKAQVDQARAPALPSLTSTAYYQRLDHDRKIAGTVISPADQVNADLLLTVPIVQPKGWTQWWHANDNVDISKASSDEVRRQLALATARTYLGIVAQHRVIEVAVRARDAARAHYQYAHQRWVGGYGTRVDEVRAAQEIATDESTLQSDVSQLARLRESLGVLVGVDQALDVEEVTLPTLPPLDEALRDAATIRADVVLQKKRVLAAKHVTRDDWADYAPTLALTFLPFFQYPATSSLPEFGFQGQVVLGWTIYDGGLRYGQGKERGALEREAEANLEGTVRQAQADVRAADEEVRRSTSALTAASDAAKLAAEGLSLTNLAYKAGASTNIEVIDAERVARDADTAVAVAEDAWRQATLDALIASGRFPAKQ